MINRFWIITTCWIGPYGPIHALSVFTVFNLIFGVRAARARQVSLYIRTMKALVYGVLIVAGAFTLFPGRIMFSVVSGG